jgi:uncharacterized protein (UPF0333 family)
MEAKLKKNSRAQTVLEVSVLIIIVTFALLTMAVYLKRGLQGKLRDNIDTIGEQYSPTKTNSYTEYTTDSFINKSYYMYQMTPGPFGSAFTSQSDTNETSARIGYEETGNAQSEPFF